MMKRVMRWFEQISLVFGKLLSNRAAKPILLNLGCGPNYLPGWVNIDLHGSDLDMDLRSGLPFLENECEAIAAIHVLEHFTFEEANQLLRDWYRVLKPGGILRISVPDLELFARKYVDRDIEFYSQPGPYDGKRFAGDTLGQQFMFVAMGDGHKSCYDYDSLAAMLRQCGFQRVVRYAYQRGNIPNVELLDNRPDISLFVEASKNISEPTCRDAHPLKVQLVISRRIRIRLRMRLRCLLSAIRGKSRRFVSKVWRCFAFRDKPSVVDVAKQNTIDAYERIYASDRLLKEYLHPSRLAFYQEVANYCAQFRPYRVVDLGCGSGHLIKAIKYRLSYSENRVQFYGLDYAESAIARAVALVPDGFFKVGDIYNTGYEDDFFDLVLSLETLEHLHHPDEAVKEMIRICSPSGRIIVTVPDGALDKWEGHVNFWDEEACRHFLEHFAIVQEIRKLDEGRILMAMIMKP